MERSENYPEKYTNILQQMDCKEEINSFVYWKLKQKIPDDHHFKSDIILSLSLEFIGNISALQQKNTTD